MESHSFLLLLALLAGAPAAAHPFSEFRIPEHSWRSGTGRFDVWASRSRSSDVDYLRTSRTAQGNLGAGLEFGYDSDRQSRSFDMSVAGRLAGSRGESSSGWSNSRESDRAGSSVRQVRLLASQRSYLGPSAWAVGATASFLADFSQYWNRNEYERATSGRLLEREYRSDGRYTYLGAAGLTFGRGHVRDATVVMDVHVLEARLREAGTISGPLSAGTRARLAEVLLAGQEIAAAHERPDRFYWAEVERVLSESGALGSAGLDAYAVLRTREPYARQKLRRMHGAYLGVRIEAQHDHVVERGRDEYEAKLWLGDSLAYQFRDVQGLDRTTGFDDLFAGAEGELHLAAGWQWQIDASGSVSVPVSTEDDGLNVATRLSVDWIVADRWRAGCRLESARRYLRHGGAPVNYVRDGWTTQAVGFLSWFVEDQVSLDAQLASRQEVRNFRPTRYYTTDHQLTLGLTYRFLGSVSAPGLFEPMSLLR